MNTNNTLRFADGDTLNTVLSMMKGYTVDMPAAKDYVGTTTVVLVSANPNGVLVNEADNTGAPIKNATWLIPWDEIKEIIVV